jgi:hypothetical protein
MLFTEGMGGADVSTVVDPKSKSFFPEDRDSDECFVPMVDSLGVYQKNCCLRITC